MNIRNSTKWLTKTALMTALTAVCTLFISIPSVSGGHTNLSDAVIFITAMLIDPIAAGFAGGLGTMIADLIAYPTTAGFSLLFHGLEGIVVGYMLKVLKSKNKGLNMVYQVVSMLIGGVIMIVGFFVAKTFFYGTIESALVSLPRNVLQVVISIVIALLLYYPLELNNLLKIHKADGETKPDEKQPCKDCQDNNDNEQKTE